MPDPKKISNLFQEMQVRLSKNGDAWAVQHFRLLGLPSIIPGEAFSSWVWRVVATGFISRKQLLKKLKIKSRAHWVDGNPDLLDINVFQKRLNDYSISDIKSTTLHFNQRLNETHKHCLTTDLLNRRPIYRYCPSCFKEDAIPYVRKSWRLAFSYICLTHNCLLKECCPACSNLFNLEEAKFNNNEFGGGVSMRYCQVCSYDLACMEKRLDYFGIVDAILNVQLKMMQLVIADENGDSLTLKLTNSDNHKPSKSTIEINKLEYFLMSFSYYDGLTSTSVIAGLCGPRMFGDNADRVRSYFLKHRLFVNTFWFSTNIVYQIYKPKRLKDTI